MTNTTRVNNFRARVEMLLKIRNWTFRELATAIGKSPQAVYDIVDRGDPKASVLRLFAVALRTTPEELLREVTPIEYGNTFIPRN